MKLNRRDVLRVGAITAVTAGVAVPSRGAAAANGPNAASKAWAVADPWELLAPLELGSSFCDAELVRVTEPEDGAVSVELRKTGGQILRIRICKRDPELFFPTPVARSRQYDFFIANNGRGRMRTDEQDGRRVKALARLVRRNETARRVLAVGTARQRWVALKRI